jgi:serine/threonine-protein kinase SRK2
LVKPDAFRIVRSGTSGFVQLAFNLDTGEQVAIKFIERGAHMQRIVARELLNHRLCALHPHIVQLKVRLDYPAYLCASPRLAP